MIRRHIEHMVRRGLRPNTILLRTRTLRRLEIYTGRDLRDVRLDDLRSFLDRLTDVGSRATEATQLRSFYRWAVHEELLDVDPTVRLEPIRKRKYLPRPIPDDELAKALVAPPARIAPALWLAAYAGLRACDIAGLRGEHVHLHAVPATVLIEESKGGKMRSVPLSSLLIDRLGGMPVQGWWFPRRDGRPGPLPAHMISKLANEYLHGLGIDHTLHTLRHWFGTKAYQASDHDLLTVRDLMGHESIETTRGYAWVDPGDGVLAVERLPNVTERQETPDLTAGG